MPALVFRKREPEERSTRLGYLVATLNFAIISSMTMPADALGLGVVGEGVETAEELAKLRAVKCELAQGYHISPCYP